LDLIEEQDCRQHIPPRRHRYDAITHSKQRTLIERLWLRVYESAA
jgi:hypothetical protein